MDTELEQHPPAPAAAEDRDSLRQFRRDLLGPGIALAGFFLWRSLLLRLTERFAGAGYLGLDATPFWEIAYIGVAAYLLLTWRRRALGAAASVGVAGALCALWLALACCGLIVLCQLNYFGVLIILLVPLAEELFFRELLLRSLARPFGWPLALLLNVALFVFMHTGQEQDVLWQMALLGLACGLLLWRFGIVAAVLGHAIWNSVALFVGVRQDALLFLSSAIVLVIWLIALYFATNHAARRIARAGHGK